MDTAKPPTITDFLLARIAEDEDTAKRAAWGWGAAWRDETDHLEEWSTVHADGKSDMVGCEDGDVTKHIARHDPARALAECAAKRVVITAEVAAHVGTRREYVEPRMFDTIAARVNTKPLRALAAVYAGHSDYDPAWAD